MATLDGVFTALSSLIKSNFNYQESDPTPIERDIAKKVFTELKNSIQSSNSLGANGSSGLRSRQDRNTFMFSTSHVRLLNEDIETQRNRSEDDVAPRNTSGSVLSRYLTKSAAPSSPFYSGKTTYGGASSRRVSRISSNPYAISQRMPTSVRIQVNNKQAEMKNNLSTAAKAILKSMEKSSPLEDAKKLAEQANTTVRSRLNVHSFRPKQQLQPVVENKSGNRNLRWELLQGDINVSDKRAPADLKTQADGSRYTQSEAGGKMSRPTRYSGRVSSKIQEECDTPYELPQASLPMPDKLPVFNLPFANFKKSNQEKADKGSLPLKRVHEESLSNTEFTFSPPIATTMKTNEDVSLNESGIVKFSSPKLATTGVVNPLLNTASDHSLPKQSKYSDQEKSSTLSAQTSLPQSMSLSSSTSSRTDDSKKEPEKLKLSIDPTFAPKPGSWTCSDCFAGNIESSSRCVACEKLKDSIPETANLSFDSKVKQSSAAAAVKTLESSVFKPTLKIPTKWTCDSCLVPNDESVEKCVCCENPKQKVVSSEAAKANYSGFKFEAFGSSSTPFKFGTPNEKPPSSTPITVNSSKFTASNFTPGSAASTEKSDSQPKANDSFAFGSNPLAPTTKPFTFGESNVTAAKPTSFSFGNNNATSSPIFGSISTGRISSKTQETDPQFKLTGASPPMPAKLPIFNLPSTNFQKSQQENTESLPTKKVRDENLGNSVSTLSSTMTTNTRTNESSIVKFGSSLPAATGVVNPLLNTASDFNLPNQVENSYQKPSLSLSISPSFQLNRLTEESKNEPGKLKFSIDPTFAPKPGSWTCSDCMVSNVESSSRCVACEKVKDVITVFSKPSTDANKQMAETVGKTIGNSLFKSTPISSVKWTCDSCLVPNEESAEKCVCCENKNPKHKVSSSEVDKSNQSGFKFGASNTMFKFGTNNDKSITSSTMNSGSVVTGNNFTFKSSNFTFGGSAPPIEKPDSQPKMNNNFVFGNNPLVPATKPFTFGESTASTAPKPSSFAFGNNSATSPPIFGMTTPVAPQPLSFQTVQQPSAPGGQPSFNFGQASATAPPLFQFNATADSSSLGSVPGRNIKKAKRRLNPTS